MDNELENVCTEVFAAKFTELRRQMPVEAQGVTKIEILTGMIRVHIYEYYSHQTSVTRDINFDIYSVPHFINTRKPTYLVSKMTRVRAGKSRNRGSVPGK